MNIYLNRIIYTLSLIIMLSGNMNSYTYLTSCTNNFYGDSIYGISANIIGAGGVSISSAGGPDALYNNAASMILDDEGLVIKGSFNITYLFERVDEFVDSDIDQGYNSYFAFNMQSYGISYNLKNILAVGFAWYPFRNMDYQNNKIHYVDDEDKNSHQFYSESIISKGSIDKYSIGLAVRTTDKFILGGNLNIIYGKTKFNKEKNYFISGYTNEYFESLKINKGINISTGMLLKTKKFRLGLSFDFPWKLNVNENIKQNSGYTRIEKYYKIPLTISSGITIIVFLNSSTTFISFDTGFQFWSLSKFKIEKINGSVYKNNEEKLKKSYSLMKNTLKINFGVEHILKKKFEIPVRYGFFYEPLYINSKYHTTGITIGTGIIIKTIKKIKIHINLSYMLGFRKGMGENYPEFLNEDYEKMITELLSHLTISLKLNI